MKTLPVLTSACLPPAGYVKIILQHGGAIIDESEPYRKQTIRNHYDILSANGRLRLVVPVVHHYPAVTMRQVSICYSEKWQRQHLHALQSAYGRAPYFLFYFDELHDILMSAPEKLSALNRQLLQWIFRCMKIQPVITYGNAPDPIGELDYRQGSSKKSNDFLSLTSSLRYLQVFSCRFGFIGGLSIADLIFNCGPQSAALLLKQ
jgi:hypothetical protein